MERQDSTTFQGRRPLVAGRVPRFTPNRRVAIPAVAGLETWFGLFSSGENIRQTASEKPIYEDHPELVSPSVILNENWTMQRHREFGGHDTDSRRFVELLYMPRTLHSGLEVSA